MNPSKLSVLPPELLSALEAQPDLRLAVVFGSVARGQAGPDSDLDIAVLADGPLDGPRREALIRVLAQATGRPVDLVDLWSADVLVSREALGHNEAWLSSSCKGNDFGLTDVSVAVAPLTPSPQCN
jgi:predicted nucleotidyltransferase